MHFRDGAFCPRRSPNAPVSRRRSGHGVQSLLALVILEGPMVRHLRQPRRPRGEPAHLGYGGRSIATEARPRLRIEWGVGLEPCSQHQRQNNSDDDEARKSVRDEPYPDALIPLRGKGLSQRPVEDAGGHTPWLVHVVGAKDGPVDDPSRSFRTPCAFAAARVRGRTAPRSPEPESSPTRAARTSPMSR